MKLLLINPFLTTEIDDSSQPTMLLSLPYLAAYLERHNFEVDILDIAGLGFDNISFVTETRKRYGLSEEEIVSRIKGYMPELVGITACSTTHADDIHELARIVKSINPEIKIIVGGAHASSSPEAVIKDKNIDIVVIGEGEDTLLEIVQQYDRQRIFKNIPGTLIRDGENIIKNNPREYIKDLDEIPFPARHLLPMDNYLKILSKGINYTMRQRAASMITSRGCPGDCIYCAVKTVWGRKWRGRSPKNIVDEIEELIRKYKIKEIHFLDDSMSVDKKRLMEICDEIIKRRLDIKWATPNGIAIWLMDKLLIKKMEKAGCYRLTFGLESGNRETLNFIGKHYDYDYAKEIIRFANRLGIWTIGTFIIGFPYEKINSIEDTIDFAIDSGLDFAVFYTANPYPGTRLYEHFLKEGLITKEERLVNRGANTKYFTQKELENIQSQAFSKFLRSRIAKPWRLLNKIRSIEDIGYIIKLSKHFSRIIFNRTKIEKEGIAAFWKRNEN